MVFPEPWHIQNHNQIQNPSIFTTLVYSEPSHIQNAGVFEAYPRHIQNPVKHQWWSVLRKQLTAIIIFANYNYFCSVSLITAFSISWNKYDEVVTLKVAILCKKTIVREGTRDREFLIYPLIYSNKLAYLQLISVLERVNELIFRTCNLTKNELFLRFFWTFSRILFKSFRGLLLQNTS